jgi:hypothetical protein
LVWRFGMLAISARRTGLRYRSRAASRRHLALRSPNIGHRGLSWKRLPADIIAAPARVLKRRPSPTAHRAPRMLAQHVRRCIGTPSNYVGRKRDSDAVAACVTA